MLEVFVTRELRLGSLSVSSVCYTGDMSGVSHPELALFVTREQWLSSPNFSIVVVREPCFWLPNVSTACYKGTTARAPTAITIFFNIVGSHGSDQSVSAVFVVREPWLGSPSVNSVCY